MKALKTLTLLIVFSPAAQALDLGHDLTLSGFGTLGSVSTSNDQANYVSDPYFQHSNSPGRSTGTSFVLDSKFALQLDWQATDRLRFTAQGITRHGSDSTWNPELQLAFAKFALMPELAIRAGRIRPPTYMQSDYLDVNYANPWVRPPSELYASSPIRYVQGVDVLWRPKTGSVSWLVQPFYGTSKINTQGIESILSFDDVYGINVSASVDDFSLRVGYQEASFGFNSKSVNSVLSTLSLLCRVDSVACSQKSLLTRAHNFGSYLAAGGTWDNGDYFLSSEYGIRDSDTTLSHDYSWYVSGGARFGKLTPYMSYAVIENLDSMLFTAGTGDLAMLDPRLRGLGVTTNNVMSQVLQSNRGNQSTISLGLRYDVISNVALKFQWDRVDTFAIAGVAGSGHGLFKDPTAAFKNSSNAVDLFSVSMDFVF